MAGIGLEIGQILLYILLVTVNSDSEIHLRHDSHGRHSEFLPDPLARQALCDRDSAWTLTSGSQTAWHEQANTVASRTGRIRATSGTTSAGLAIGITNVSKLGKNDRIKASRKL